MGVSVTVSESESTNSVIRIFFLLSPTQVRNLVLYYVRGATGSRGLRCLKLITPLRWKRR